MCEGMILREWKTSAQALVTTHGVGCLMVNSHALQTGLVEAVNKALDVLKLLLTNAAHKECIKVLNLLHELIRYIRVLIPLQLAQESIIPGLFDQTHVVAQLQD